MAASGADCYKYKRIAVRLSGLSGPVGNRITNDSHNATIRSSDGNVNKFSADAQRAQMYADKKKESIADISDATQASEKTSETSAGTAPDTNISTSSGNVKQFRSCIFEGGGRLSLLKPAAKSGIIKAEIGAKPKRCSCSGKTVPHLLAK